MPRQEADDPEGDLSGRAGVVPPSQDLRALDLLGVAMERTPQGLLMSGRLAADPRATAEHEFYYWISFEAEEAAGGGNPATWTFQRTTTYETIRSMYWEADRDYGVEWNGTAFSFTVPWEHLEEQYGKAWPMDVGSPSLSSSGPHMRGDPIGYVDYAASAVLGWYDWVEFDRSLVPLPDCGPAVAEGASAEDGSEAPGAAKAPPFAARDLMAPAALVLAGAALLVALARRR